MGRGVGMQIALGMAGKRVPGLAKFTAPEVQSQAITCPACGHPARCDVFTLISCEGSQTIEQITCSNRTSKLRPSNCPTFRRDAVTKEEYTMGRCPEHIGRMSRRPGAIQEVADRTGMDIYYCKRYFQRSNSARADKAAILDATMLLVCGEGAPVTVSEEAGGDMRSAIERDRAVRQAKDDAELGAVVESLVKSARALLEKISLTERISAASRAGLKI